MFSEVAALLHGLGEAIKFGFCKGFFASTEVDLRHGQVKGGFFRGQAQHLLLQFNSFTMLVFIGVGHGERVHHPNLIGCALQRSFGIGDSTAAILLNQKPGQIIQCDGILRLPLQYAQILLLRLHHVAAVRRGLGQVGRKQGIPRVFAYPLVGKFCGIRVFLPNKSTACRRIGALPGLGFLSARRNAAADWSHRI
jgi:hypothetical protein